jgi:hypothetical protein
MVAHKSQNLMQEHDTMHEQHALQFQLSPAGPHLDHLGTALKHVPAFTVKSIIP